MMGGMGLPGYNPFAGPEAAAKDLQSPAAERAWVPPPQWKEEDDYWSAHPHPEHKGKLYFYNSKTKVSTWVRPEKNSRGQIVPDAVIEAATKAGEGEEGTATPPPPTPMSWSRLRRPGLSGDTPWYVVLTDQSSRFFCNRKTGVSTWELPQEVTKIYAERAQFDQSKKAERSRGILIDDEEQRRRKLAADAAGKAELTNEQKNARFAEQGKAKKAKIEAYKAMLEEHGVKAFAKWPTEQPKFSDDPRYLALLTMAERRGAFDAFVRAKATSAKKEAAARLKAGIEGFTAMLAELAEQEGGTSSPPSPIEYECP